MTSPGEQTWWQRLTPLGASQVGPIVAEFSKHQIQIGGVVAPNGGIEYMYETGCLLVRDEGSNLDRIGAAVGQPDLRARAEPVISGLVRVALDITALDIIDALVGDTEPPIATPNHVLTLAQSQPYRWQPWPVTPCPATEPEPSGLCPWPSPPVRKGDAGAQVKIYVADTGLLKDACTHPWLRGVDGDEDPLPDPQHIPVYTGHGTFVAGLARSQAPAADIYVEAAFNQKGSELESEAIKRLHKALGQGYDIFNVSAATTTRNDHSLLAFDVWLRLLRERTSALCLVPAGNNNSPQPHWPAAEQGPGLISVGATTLDGKRRAYFSDYGPWVDVYAPGEDLVNAYARGTYTCEWWPETGQRRHFRRGMARWAGTCFATGIVTGLVAARMHRRDEDARQAAEALLQRARAHPVAGVGPVLMPRPASCRCRLCMTKLTARVKRP
jgi:subtilisin family serine protease